LSTNSTWATFRQRLLGLGLIALIAGLIALSLAVYNKAFSSFVTVKLQSKSIGNQLLERSDVKMHGMNVGEVAAIDAQTRGATLTLQLDPESAQEIPANVSARIVPKTLFGERYVEFRMPEDPTGGEIADGDVIPKSRTSSATKLSKVMNNLLPVLRAVEPQKLSVTLSSLSNALDGRGESIGQTLSELGEYMGELEPHVPQLEHDLDELATFADNLDEAAPEAIDALDNLVTTAKTVVDKRMDLQKLYGTLNTVAVDTRNFLAANRQNLVRLMDSARPIADLLAEYAPEYPCVIGQMADLVPRLNKVFGKGTGKPGLHAMIEITVTRGKYEPGQDEPRYNEERGPRCYKFSEYPEPFPQQPPDGPIKDGAEDPPPARTAQDGLNPPYTGAKTGGYGGGGAAGSSAGQLSYSPAEHEFLSQLIGPQVGMSAADVPGWNSLLVAPLYRGAEVHAK